MRRINLASCVTIATIFLAGLSGSGSLAYGRGGGGGGGGGHGGGGHSSGGHSSGGHSGGGSHSGSSSNSGGSSSGGGSGHSGAGNTGGGHGGGGGQTGGGSSGGGSGSAGGGGSSGGSGGGNHGGMTGTGGMHHGGSGGGMHHGHGTHSGSGNSGGGVYIGGLFPGFGFYWPGSGYGYSSFSADDPDFVNQQDDYQAIYTVPQPAVAPVVPLVPPPDGGQIILFVSPDATNSVTFTLNGQSYSLQPGESQTLVYDRAWTIEFPPAPGQEPLRYALHSARFKFKPSGAGIGLFQTEDLPPAKAPDPSIPGNLLIPHPPTD